MSTGRCKLEIHIIPQFYLLRRVKRNQIIVRIVISPSCYKRPKHILTCWRLQIPFSQQVRKFIIKSHTNERIFLTGRFFYHSQLDTYHTVNHLCTFLIICRRIRESRPERLVVYTTESNLPQILLFVTAHRFDAILPKLNQRFFI